MKEANQVRAAVKNLQKKYGDKVKVYDYDIDTQKGRTEWQKTGMNMGGILINGKNSFKIGKRKVKFQQILGVGQWKIEDLEEVIKHELK